MAASPTHTATWPRLAAQDRHGPKASVRLALSTFAPRRPASAIHDHLTAWAEKATI